MFKTVLIFSLILFANTAFCQVEFSNTRKLEGFNWYSEKQMQEQKKKEEEGEANREKLPDNMKQQKEMPSYEQNIKRLKEDHKQAHMKALDDPTKENLLAEIRLEKEMMRKSKLYGERRVIAEMLASEFDSVDSPNNLHRKVQEEEEDKDIAEKLNILNKDWGLVLEIDKNCTYCKTFAPIAENFAKKHGFQLIAASKDGEEFMGISGVERGDTLLALNPKKMTPVLYLLKSDGKEIIPISKGINNELKIISNLKAIDQHVRRLF